METPERKLFTISCEGIFNTHPDVFRSALVGVEHVGRVWPVICVELEESGRKRSWQDIERELRELAVGNEFTRNITAFLPHRGFPVDIRHNAKIFREKLAVWSPRASSSRLEADSFTERRENLMTALVTRRRRISGHGIVRRLREQGVSVRSFSRQLHPILTDRGVEQRQGDLADFDARRRCRAGLRDCVPRRRQSRSLGRYRDYYRVNVIGTENVLKACREHAVRKLVFTSSPSVVYHGVDQNGVDESEPYPRRFLSPYPETKAIAERMILAANGPDLATVALRPHLIWGPGDPHLISAAIGRVRGPGNSGKLAEKINSSIRFTWITRPRHVCSCGAEAFDRFADRGESVFPLAGGADAIMGFHQTESSKWPTCRPFSASSGFCGL